MKTIEGERFYNAAETAEILGLNVDTIRKYTRLGQINYVYIGCRMYSENELRRIAKEGLRKTYKGQ